MANRKNHGVADPPPPSADWRIFRRIGGGDNDRARDPCLCAYFYHARNCWGNFRSWSDTRLARGTMGLGTAHRVRLDSDVSRSRAGWRSGVLARPPRHRALYSSLGVHPEPALSSNGQSPDDKTSYDSLRRNWMPDSSGIFLADRLGGKRCRDGVL